ncbi:hypothetical protein [Stenotrophomonas maltophilia]|uniref:hypothetical protein n=1 Tax=Stenotrophomonas maltophilia group TaxID=995085 RepID=UPI001311B6BF|nr:hypothetical protein [Stenotrophomonas maltophilia]
MTGALDWQAIGTAIGGLVVGAGGVGLWWRKQQVESARQGAEVDVIQLMRDEITRLGARVGSLEAREGRMIRHIYRLEGLMRGSGIEPPPFDIDSDTIKAGGSE